MRRSPIGWPRLSGTGENVGATIYLRSTSLVGSMFAGSPTGYGYRWLGCDGASRWDCIALGPATASPTIHTIGAADVGTALRLEITAHNGSGDSPPVLSGTTAVIRPLNTAAPTITGVPRQGETLSATAGTWVGDPSSFRYEWRRCSSTGASCAAITGATAGTYLLANADVGTTIRVAVTASK